MAVIIAAAVLAAAGITAGTISWHRRRPARLPRQIALSHLQGSDDQGAS